jgi:hypothetical protein
MNNRSLIQILSIPLFLIKLKILTQNLFFMEKVLYITCDLLWIIIIKLHFYP